MVIFHGYVKLPEGKWEYPLVNILKMTVERSSMPMKAKSYYSMVNIIGIYWCEWIWMEYHGLTIFTEPTRTNKETIGFRLDVQGGFINKDGDVMILIEIPCGKHIKKTMERSSTLWTEKLTNFLWSFSIADSYVKLPEGIIGIYWCRRILMEYKENDFLHETGLKFADSWFPVLLDAGPLFMVVIM